MNSTSICLLSTTCKVLGIKVEHISVLDLQDLSNEEPTKYNVII